jgi:uncharacterized protein YecE (DUF72 family)
VYRDWRGVLYPRDLPAERWLAHYAKHFRTLELNATFYRLPSVEAVQGWFARTPPRFVFVAKGSRFLTHMKRLTDFTVGLGRFFERVDHLGRKLDTVLWQLPPQMKRPDPERLDRFLAHAPDHVRHAFEFRDLGWYTEEVCDVLDAHRAALVEHDLLPRPPPRVCGGFRYLRFHGASAPYHGRYGPARLRPIARELARWKRRGDVFAFFNNDREGHAVRDALALQLLASAKRDAPLAGWMNPLGEESAPL